MAEDLLKPPVNAKRISLHPKGLAQRIENYAEWRAHLLARLRKQVQLMVDPVLKDLLEEASAYPQPEGRAPGAGLEQAVLVPLRIRTSLGVLSFMSTTIVFGTPVDVTPAELAIEMFFPAVKQARELIVGNRPELGVAPWLAISFSDSHTSPLAPGCP